LEEDMRRLGFVRVSVLAGALWIVFASAAYAAAELWSTTGPDPTIEACQSIKDGALRVVGSTTDCGKNEIPLAWSVVGPKGDKGDTGVSVTTSPEPSGSNCAAGGSRFAADGVVTFACNGVTRVWSPARVHQLLVPRSPDGVITSVTMFTLPLPAGRYLATAALTLDFRFGGSLAGCSIFPLGEGATTISATSGGGIGGVASPPVLGTFSLPSGGALELTCNQNDQGPGQVQADELLVIQQVDVVN
jgi:hypothetical protein